LADRAAAALAAGCDVALHCNGKAEEMTAVAGAVPALTAAAERRLAAATARLAHPPPLDELADMDMPAMRARLDGLMAAAG